MMQPSQQMYNYGNNVSLPNGSPADHVDARNISGQPQYLNDNLSNQFNTMHIKQPNDYNNLPNNPPTIRPYYPNTYGSNQYNQGARNNNSAQQNQQNGMYNSGYFPGNNSSDQSSMYNMNQQAPIPSNTNVSNKYSQPAPPPSMPLPNPLMPQPQYQQVAHTNNSNQLSSNQGYSGPSYASQKPSPYRNIPGYEQPKLPQSVNTDGLPSAVEVIEMNRNKTTGPFFTAQRGVIPPLATTDFITRDQGVCSPRYIRSDYYAVPATSDLLKSIGVPFTISVSPFAEQHPEDMQILVSNSGPQGPMRCIRCKAYMNPFMNFIDGGRRFQCPMCSGATDVSPDYFSHLDHMGRRLDTSQRPELCLGSYDLTTTAEYCKNNELPLPPAFIFLLDVSQSSIRSGLVHLFCSQFVEKILPKLPKDSSVPADAQSSIRIGFVTYDHQLHFYNLAYHGNSGGGGGAGGADRTNSNQLKGSTTTTTATNEFETNDNNLTFCKPQMHIVVDIEDVFVPAVEGFLIPPDPNAINCLLNIIMTQFGGSGGATSTAAATAANNNSQTHNQQHHTIQPDALLGPAIQCGLEALRAANRCGKLFVMHSNLPTVDAPGKLKNRDDRRLVGTEKEKTLLVPDGDFYTGLGQMCVNAGCSVDLFLFPSAYVDVATLAEVPRLTAGHIYKYNCFQAEFQGQQFLSDLGDTLSRIRALNAVMRVRTSTGIRPVEYYGNCYIPDTTNMELACVSSDTAISVELRHDDKLQDNDLVFIQVACLYTSISGQRRLRVHNLSLGVTSTIAEVFRLVDLDTYMNWLCKYAMRGLLNRPLNSMLDELTTRTATTLATYRKCCTGTGAGEVGSNPSELVLPQNMKLLPLYVQCLMKTEAFSSADGITIDDRCWQMFLVNSMDVRQTCSYLYPPLYLVSDLSVNFEGDVPYPLAAIRCSFSRMQPNGAYLLDNGIHLILWIGSNIDLNWLQSVFHLTDPQNFEAEKIYDLCPYNNEISRILHILLTKIRRDRVHYSRLLIVRSGDKNEMWFRRFMVEDRKGTQSVSYTEYLCHIHKEVSGLLR